MNISQAFLFSATLSILSLTADASFAASENEASTPDRSVSLSRVAQCDARDESTCRPTKIPSTSNNTLDMSAYWRCDNFNTKKQQCDLQILTCDDYSCAQIKPHCNDIDGIPCSYTTDVGRPDYIPLIIGTYWHCFEWSDHEICRIKLVVCDEDEPGFCVEL